ncbi:MAG: hypothetical protein EOP11_14285 [Proteobacteria bacterium]|nr:MAG: hypothetical protein EOP11_14285 [Pseudomonadota bacterium]
MKNFTKLFYVSLVTIGVAAGALSSQAGWAPVAALSVESAASPEESWNASDYEEAFQAEAKATREKKRGIPGRPPRGGSGYSAGSTNFYSDGTSSYSAGSTEFYSDGTSSYSAGSTQFYSDGRSSYSAGSTTFYSDGRSSYTAGSTTFYSDGTSCYSAGSTQFCS